MHVSRGVTTHGLAINVNNDLQPFEWIVPCGIEGCRVTSLGRELGAEQDLDAFADTLAARFGEVFEREPVATELGRLEPTSVRSHDERDRRAHPRHPLPGEARRDRGRGRRHGPLQARPQAAVAESAGARAAPTTGA